MIGIGKSMKCALKYALKKTAPGIALAAVIFLLAPAGGAADVLEDRQRLLEAFRGEGADAMPLLIGALDDERPLVNRTAAHLLGRLGEEGLAGIEAALVHPNANLRLIAIDYLVEMEKITLYWPIIMADEEPVIRRKVQLDLLERFPMPEGEEMEALLSGLMEVYAASPASRRRHLLMTFAALDDITPGVQELLVAAAADEDDDIRLSAYEAILEHIGRDWEKADELLDSALADESGAIREIGRQLRWKLLEVEQVRLPARGWRFETDPEGGGRGAGWYAPDFDDSDWRTDVPIEANWQNHLEEEYFGAAWYRISVDVSRPESWDRAYLYFGGVDEEAWVWLNGQFVGSHEMGVDGWDVPFVLDVTEAFKPGEANVIAVMAKNTGAAGGIWRPVRLRVLDTTILD